MELIYLVDDDYRMIARTQSQPIYNPSEELAYLLL
jgi:hypothetical protein